MGMFKMFKNMGGNIPGGNFLGGNFPGGSLMGGDFPGGSFPDTLEGTRVKNVDIVPLKITSPIKTIVTEAICTPKICSNVLNQDVKTVSSNYEHLRELADSSPETTKCIDVLMGADYYILVLQEKLKGEKIKNHLQPIYSKYRNLYRKFMLPLDYVWLLSTTFCFN